MTQEEFIKKLKREDYYYEIEGDKVVVACGRYVYLDDLTSLPPGVEFRNGDYVSLDSLTSLPPGVVFKNRGHVDLDSLTSIPSGVVFKNEGVVNLDALIGGRLDEWKGNIKGIDSKRLLNSMISKGIFER
jgi:hypothetical protein